MARAAVVLALLLGCLAFYAYRIEPYHVVERRITIKVSGLPRELDGLRVVHICDTHTREFGKREDDAVRIASRARPDIVAMTGDYTGYDWPERTGPARYSYLRFFRALHARYGVFVVPGGWDNFLPVSKWNETGVHTLLNQSMVVKIRGVPVAIVGLTPDGPDLGRALRGLPEGTLKILLSHEICPESIEEAARRGIVLSLTGGRHGGQVRIPLIAKLYGRSHDVGLSRIGGRMWHYASAGVGVSHLHARLFCPPEVAVITLKRG